MTPEKGVPQRGDGFDSPGTSVQAAGEDRLAGMRGLNLKNLDLKQLLTVVASDEKATRILKDAIAGGGGGAGALAGRELNELLGQLFPEEWATGLGAFAGGFGAGLVNKRIKKPVGRRKR